MSLKRNLELVGNASAFMPLGAAVNSTTAVYSAEKYPYFANSAKDAFVYDADGNKYVDLNSDDGACVLGHANKQIDDAVIEAIKQGNCTSLLSDVTARLAKKIVEVVKSAEFASFTSDGESALLLAVRVARSCGKKKLLFFKDCNKGFSTVFSAADECGVLVEDVCNNLYVHINDLDSLKDIIKKYDGEIAAMVATPYLFGASKTELPADNYWKEVRHLLLTNGIALIIDDTKSGLHLSVSGSDAYYGIEADMVCFGRSMANGYPFGCLCGKAKYKNVVAALAKTNQAFNMPFSHCAAEKCLEIVCSTEYTRTTEYLTRRLIRELCDVADGVGAKLITVGEGNFFTMSFSGDDGALMRAFCLEMAARGVLIPPSGEVFINYAVTESDIDFIVNQAKLSFDAVQNLK